MPSSRYHNTTLPVAELTLLNAALNLFLRHPIDTLSMTLIHRSAGVSKATFYQYFSGKKDLWAGLLLEEEHARLALLACLPEKPEWNDWRTFFLGLMASPEKQLMLRSLETRLLVDPPAQLRRYQQWLEVRPTLLNRLANGGGEDGSDGGPKKQELAVLWCLLEGWLNLYLKPEFAALGGGRRPFTKLMAGEMAHKMVLLHADN